MLQGFENIRSCKGLPSPLSTPTKLEHNLEVVMAVWH
ncbi:hypothetical protein I3760_03G128200 [Carya illinoinensis]|nr:hypothetical protein I3760_03G128200 [Carya illinoinensis]